jgi:hypothetical protein
MQAMIWIVAAAAVAYLAWNLFVRLHSDSVAVFVDKRRPTSQLVCRGEYVDGNRHLDVALAVTPSTLFYENSDMQASLDLEWVREVEYATELVTGARIESGKVMRLRSDRQTFEFVIPEDSVARWRSVVPPRGRVDATPAAVPA